ncbi:aldo/keto reductase [Helicobacter muridarum]|nr:aldo/keto reductase [Helicobacter muridarum]STQ86885.1 aldo-keto reductase [Helicobacter muridarum]
MLEAAIESGITLYDTAQTYGPDSNEILVGELLKPYKNKIFITTKFGFGKDSSVLDSSPKRIREVVENSLKRLNLEQIPLLYQHRFDPKTPIEEVASCVKDLIKEGKVARFGVCELSAKTIEKAHKICPITAVQSEYHLMWRNPEKQILPTLEKLGIGFVSYSPLNRGYLSGKLTKDSEFNASNDNRATFPRFQPSAMEANYQIIEMLKEFGKGKNPSAKDSNATPAQVAIAYLLTKKPYIVPLFGTTNKVHLEDNLKALAVKLSDADIKAIDSSLDKIIIVGDRYPAEQANRVGK